MAIFKGDQNVILELEFRDYEEVDGVPTDKAALNISQASEITFLFKKPNGTVVTKTKTGGAVAFSSDGTDGKAKYSVEAGFLDVSGEWERQGIVEFAGGYKHKSTIVTFTVKDPLG